jgi:hypothetical protein
MITLRKPVERLRRRHSRDAIRAPRSASECNPKGPDMSTLSAARPSANAANDGDLNAIKEKAKRLSIYSMMATSAAGSGHPTSCMSAAELVAGVFFHAMKFDPKNANSNDDDRAS